MDSEQSLSQRELREASVLIASVFVISLCALTYQLLISTVSTYFHGSSVLHFSITIGLFMFFMGVGSYASKYVMKDILARFIVVEIVVGAIGGFSAFLLYFSFSWTEYYYLTAFVLIAAISTLVGLEIPLVTRIMRDYQNLKDAIANIFTFDYLGALIGSIAFPLLLLPYLGTMKTAFFVGLLNVGVAILNIIEFRERLEKARNYLLLSLAACGVLIAGICYSFTISNIFEQMLYQDEIVHAEQTPYQRIVLTKYRDDTRLYLNGSLQFSSLDEYRYHEPLVHVPMSLSRNRENVLILGGGDGLAVREVLKYSDVKKVTVVDIDPAMTKLAQEHRALAALNKSALEDSRVEIEHADAYTFIQNSSEAYSVIIIDLPDPSDEGLSKLYSKEFYHLLKRRLAVDGMLVSQSTSPYFGRKAFWCINETMKSAFPRVLPYTVHIPSFGQWGFNLASHHTIDINRAKLLVPMRFLTQELLPSFFLFDSDISHVPVEINQLETHVLLEYYTEGWSRWN